MAASWSRVAPPAPAATRLSATWRESGEKAALPTEPSAWDGEEMAEARRRWRWPAAAGGEGRGEGEVEVAGDGEAAVAGDGRSSRDVDLDLDRVRLVDLIHAELCRGLPSAYPRGAMPRAALGVVLFFIFFLFKM